MSDIENKTNNKEKLVKRLESIKDEIDMLMIEEDFGDIKILSEDALLMAYDVIRDLIYSVKRSGDN